MFNEQLQVTILIFVSPSKFILPTYCVKKANCNGLVKVVTKRRHTNDNNSGEKKTKKVLFGNRNPGHKSYVL